MNMNTILEQIEGIELKINQLVSRCEKLKTENINLLKINNELKDELASKNANLLQMEQKAGDKNVSKMQLKQENEKIREEIDQYIEELAMCIEMIEKV